MEDQRKCTDCGTLYTHEPMMIGDWDMLAEIRCCPECSELRSETFDREEREKKTRSVWQEAIPKTYRETDVKHPDYQAQMTTHHLAQKWLRGEPTEGAERMLFLGLIGESGLCKSRIIAQLCRRLVWQGARVTWVNSSRFQWCAQNQFSDEHGQGAKEWLKRYQTTAHLVFDDIGSLKATEAVSDNLYALLEHRTAHGLPVMWTSNETQDEMLVGGKISEKARLRSVSRLVGFSNILNLSIPKL